MAGTLDRKSSFSWKDCLPQYKPDKFMHVYAYVRVHEIKNITYSMCNVCIPLSAYLRKLE